MVQESVIVTHNINSTPKEEIFEEFSIQENIEMCRESVAGDDKNADKFRVYQEEGEEEGKKEMVKEAISKGLVVNNTCSGIMVELKKQEYEEDVSQLENGSRQNQECYEPVGKSPFFVQEEKENQDEASSKEKVCVIQSLQPSMSQYENVKGSETGSKVHDNQEMEIFEVGDSITGEKANSGIGSIRKDGFVKFSSETRSRTENKLHKRKKICFSVKGKTNKGVSFEYLKRDVRIMFPQARNAFCGIEERTHPLVQSEKEEKEKLEESSTPSLCESKVLLVEQGQHQHNHHQPPHLPHQQQQVLAPLNNVNLGPPSSDDDSSEEEFQLLPESPLREQFPRLADLPRTPPAEVDETPILEVLPRRIRLDIHGREQCHLWNCFEKRRRSL